MGKEDADSTAVSFLQKGAAKLDKDPAIKSTRSHYDNTFKLPTCSRRKKQVTAMLACSQAWSLIADTNHQ